MTLRIEVDGLQLRYGAVTALDDLSFTLDGGKIYGLLGRNGSGKTSLLSVLAAFRRVSGGAVRIDGQPVFENPLITRQVCLIRETGDTGDTGDRVRDALYTAEHLRPGWDSDYADSLVERFQIPRGKKLGELSLGQRSALGMTFGLAARAPVTLFDESHLGMDAPSRAAFHDELLVDFMAHPRTIVISTHLIDELSPLFEEVVIIDDGRLVLQDETEVLRARGAAVTGPAEAVDRFVAGHTVLGERQLGRTKSAMVYGGLDDSHRRQARDAGLDLGPIALQELFVHLTRPSGGSR
jgi:ABC-2 type transport system ATP-binding protein